MRALQRCLRIFSPLSMLTDIKPGLKYRFEMLDPSARSAISNLAAVVEVESTLSLAKDARVRQAFPDVRVLNDGRAIVFKDDDGIDWREFDGLLVSPSKNTVLLVCARLGVTPADVTDAANTGVDLENILHGKVKTSNFPQELDSYRQAQVIQVVGCDPLWDLMFSGVQFTFPSTRQSFQ